MSEDIVPWLPESAGRLSDDELSNLVDDVYTSFMTGVFLI